MADAITITLAGANYTVEPLTLGEIEDLGAVVVKAPQSDGKIFAGAIDIIVQALKKKNPEVTAALLRGSYILPAELRAAQAKILKLSGLAEPGKVEPPGPAPGAPSTGPSSTDASPAA